jgi:hypothetical protein
LIIPQMGFNVPNMGMNTYDKIGWATRSFPKPRDGS